MANKLKDKKARTPEQDAMRDIRKQQIKEAFVQQAIVAVPTLLMAAATTAVGYYVTQGLAAKNAHKQKPTKVILPDDYEVFYPTTAPSDI